MREKNSLPLVSIIITNYNGLNHLTLCLPSIVKQDYPSIEVILVDNHSSDKSVSFVKKNYPRVVIIKQSKNHGYAQGNNIGYSHAKGSYIMILNNDTVLETNLVSQLLTAFTSIPKLGAVQPKVKLMNNPHTLDSCGSYWTNTGFNYHVGNYKNEELPIYNRPFPVYSLKGVCMMIPRTVIEKVGLFDKDFWCYFEETDFCHRVWLAGYECWYYPKTSLLHALGGTRLKKSEAFIQFHSFKNRLCSYLKNLGTKEMIVVVPWYLLLTFIWGLYRLMNRDFSYFASVYRALYWNVINISSTLKKREYIQKKLRKLSDGILFRRIRKEPRISYYVMLVKGLQYYTDAI